MLLEDLEAAPDAYSIVPNRLLLAAAHEALRHGLPMEGHNPTMLLAAKVGHLTLAAIPARSGKHET